MVVSYGIHVTTRTLTFKNCPPLFRMGLQNALLTMIQTRVCIIVIQELDTGFYGWILMLFSANVFKIICHIILPSNCCMRMDHFMSVKHSTTVNSHRLNNFGFEDESNFLTVYYHLLIPQL